MKERLMFDIVPLTDNLLLNFPKIQPVAFSLGPIKVHWYGLGYLFGIILAYLYGCYLLNNKSLWLNKHLTITKENLSDFIIWVSLGIVLGGRFGEVFFWNPAYYFYHPSQIIAVWHGGMAFHGGLLGVIFASALFTYYKQINYLTLSDILAAGAPIGLFLVRICNFINGELWGKVSYVPWAIIFPRAGNLPRHPSQLYEAGLEGIIIFSILYFCIFKRNFLQTPGKTASLFCILYSVLRIIAECFREKDPAPAWFEHIFHNTNFSYGMFLSLPMLVLGLCLYFYCVKINNYDPTKTNY